ncbi:MAG TPA: aminotransferase class V-fold PLP-dependent enzyme [Solirubrobacteraceae bacterium]|nr:aminotransferase class V-fold PLP-dependent enzyme [Solirubrobacteraceae bacterium]
MTDPERFREQFPVFANTAYLNSGTEGPVPKAAVEAVRERVEQDAASGRAGRAYFDEVIDLAARSRAAYATLLGARPEQVALTGSTTDGVNTVLGGLRFASGDEILTTDEEHPGLLAPLRLSRIRHGVSIRVVPFAELAAEVGPRTRLIACSHVSWVGGRVADVPALVATGIPVLLDAAQALGAIPVDVEALGCAYYAASGQKWLCGPEGSGCLYVRPDRLDDLEPPWPGYATLSDHDNILESGLAEGAPRLDHGFPSAIRSTWALASLQVLEDAGWEWVHERSADLAARLADHLKERGLTVAPRGRSTLVSWAVEDAEEEVKRLGESGFVVRSIPLGGLMRAAVGAWSSEEEIERLAEAAAAR